MKKLNALLIFTIVLFSCNNEVKPLTFNTEEINESSEAEINVLLARANPDYEIGKKINAKVDAIIIKSISDNQDDNLKEAIAAFNEEYIDFREDFLEDERPWRLNIESEVTYKSEEVITIALNIYTDKGGAHGNDIIRFLNFNATNGDLFTLNDIITNTADFKILAEKYFNEAVKSEADSDAPIEDFFFGKSYQLPKNIGFTDDGLILLYNVYEIASYAQGYTEFAIPFDVAKPYLKVN